MQGKTISKSRNERQALTRLKASLILDFAADAAAFGGIIGHT
jgi:hypothetical protein